MNQPVTPQTVQRQFGWRLGIWFNGLIAGDHEWGRRRMALFTLLVLAFTFMGRALDPVDATQVCMPAAVVDFLANEPAEPLIVDGVPQTTPDICLNAFTDGLPRPLAWAVNMTVSVVLPQTLRHLIPPLLAAYIVFKLGVAYVRDLFEINQLETAERFLSAAISGQNYPEVTLTSDGFAPDDKGASLARIGGPGHVKVPTGHGAVFELHGGPSLVVASGKHFIRRFETLREVVDLRDQHRKFDEVTARTKDGLRVTVQDLEVIFRVHTRNRQRTAEDQYPYTIGALRNIAYNKTVALFPDGKSPSVWTNSVPGTFTGLTRDYIMAHWLDELVRAPEVDPREDIKRKLRNAQTRASVQKKGADLIEVNLGHLVLHDGPHDQRIDVWRAEWQRIARVEIAEGEADRLRLMEYSRAFTRLQIITDISKRLAQGDPLTADMIIIHVAEALQATRSRSLPDKTRDDLGLLRRMIDTIEADRRQPPPDSDLPILEARLVDDQAGQTQPTRPVDMPTGGAAPDPPAPATPAQGDAPPDASQPGN